MAIYLHFYFLQKYLQGAELPTIWKLNLTLFGRLFPDYHVTAFSCFSFLFYVGFELDLLAWLSS